MKDILAAIVRFETRAQAAVKKAVELSLAWLSIPVHFFLALLGAVFLVSFISWAVIVHTSSFVLFFPDARTGRIEGEVRDLPRSASSEARGALVAAEELLGPVNPKLAPAFALGSQVEASMYRNRVLYVDISDEAALAGRASIEKGLVCMRRSLKAALPFAKNVVITIGGYEPYVDYQQLPAGNGTKNPKK